MISRREFSFVRYFHSHFALPARPPETLSFPAGCRIDHAASRIALGVFGEPRERQHWPYEFRALVKTKVASCDNLQNWEPTLAPFRLYAIHHRAKLVWNGHNPAHGTSDTTFRRWLRNAGARLSRWTVRDRLSCRSVGETNFYKSNRRPLAAPAAGERSIWRAHIQMRPRSFAQSLFMRTVRGGICRGGALWLLSLSFAFWSCAESEELSLGTA